MEIIGGPIQLTNCRCKRCNDNASSWGGTECYLWADGYT